MELANTVKNVEVEV